MVDPALLASDIAQNMFALATPAVAALFLFLLAWEDPGVARASGFSRKTFWLLVPVGLLGSVFGTLPFFGWAGSVLAINVAGGLVPLVLATLILYRFLGANRPALGRFLGAFALETFALFLVVILVPNGTEAETALLLVAAGAPAVLFALEAFGAKSPGSTLNAALLGLTSGAVVLTFLTTEAISGVGIVSAFPYYLFAPVLAGVVSLGIALASPSRDARAAPGVAYGTATFGTLVGADVLRQPPLYGGGQVGLLSIGGAGILDLLFLSGILAALIAYALLRLARLGPRLSADAETEGRGPTPEGLLTRAYDLSMRKESAASLAASAAAAREAAREARRFAGLPEGTEGPPWGRLGVPAWIEADQRNLDALEVRGPTEPSDVDRAWTTARWLVRAGGEIRLSRSARAWRRAAAFWIDVAFTLAPAVALWVGLAETGGPGAPAPLESITYIATALGYASYTFLYFVVAEALYGATLGKRLLGLTVVNRSAGRPGPLASLLRNAPKLVPLGVLGIGFALLTAIAVGSSVSSGGAAVSPIDTALLAFALVVLAAILVALALVPLAIGWLAIEISRERQRLGDYLAGTWVISAPMSGFDRVPPSSLPGEGRPY